MGETSVQGRIADLLMALRAAIGERPPAELPAIIGQVAVLQAETFARLVTPTGPAVGDSAEPEDRLLTIEQTAEILGLTSRWVRDHAGELPRVRLPGRLLRFSERRLRAMIKRRSYP